MIPMFRCSDDSVQELCDAGLWEYDADKDEYVFHDWADYQPDGDAVDAKRRKRARRVPIVVGRSLRMAKMANRWQMLWQTHGKPMANAMANLWQTHGKTMANR